MSSVLYAPDMWDAVSHGDGSLFLMTPARENLHGMNLAQPGSFFTQHRDSGLDATVLTGNVYSAKDVRMMAQRTVRPAKLKMDKPVGWARFCAHAVTSPRGHQRHTLLPN